VNKGEIDHLKVWVESLENRPPIITTNAPSAPTDTAKVHVLTVRIDELEREIMRTKGLIHEEEMKKEHAEILGEIRDYVKLNEADKEESRKVLDAIGASVGVKAGIEDIKDVERRFVGMLAGVGGIDQFATRDDLKRAYNTLFQQVKNITEFLVSRGDEDAMIAKKPLGGWS
jgi:hypothetical protein